MRFPSLSLPAWRPSLDWVEGLGGRRMLLYALYTTVLFLVFLLANFPVGVVVQRVVKSIELPGMQLDVADARFAWWHGFELQRIKLASTQPDQPALFEALSLYVRPGLDGLLRGQPTSVSVYGPMYGGEVSGTFSSAGGLNRATLNLDHVQVQRYPYLSTFVGGGQLAGQLSGDLTVEMRPGAAEDTHAAGELAMDKVSLTDVKVQQFPVPALHFDTAALKFSLQGTRLEVQELEADGPELKVVASGQVAMREPIGDSVLNLKLSAAPGPTSPDEVKTLLSFLPPPVKGQKPDAPRTISGTLSKPRVR